MVRRQIVACCIALMAIPVAVDAQILTCPPPARDAAECRTFHYHVRAWQMPTRTFTEIAATTDFATREKCEAARTTAQKASHTFAEQVKTSKIDGNVQADVLGECHCDLTYDPKSRSFLDEEARRRQRRAFHEIAWQTREKLLANGNPVAAQLLQAKPTQAIVFDRFLGDKLVGNVPISVTEPKALVLMETQVGANPTRLPIASDLTLLALEPAAAPALSVPPPVSSMTVAETRVGVGRPFFAYERQRITAVVDASQVLDDAALKTAIRSACDERLQALANLEVVTNASGSDSPLVRALELSTRADDHRRLLRALFGTEVAAAWDPADAKDAIPKVRLDADEAAKILDESTDPELRRSAVYALLARYNALPAAEVRTIGEAVNGLLLNEGAR